MMRLCQAASANWQERGETILRFQEAAKAHLEPLLETGRAIPAAFRDKSILAARTVGDKVHEERGKKLMPAENAELQVVDAQCLQLCRSKLQLLRV